MSRVEQPQAILPLVSRFRAMNTVIEVQLVTGQEEAEHAADLVQNWFETQERRFSRFVPDSELNRLNRSTGWLPVSAAMDEVLSLAYGYIGQTEGIFQPGIAQALRQQGYDVSFEQLQSDQLNTQLDYSHTAQPLSSTSSDERFDYCRPGWMHREGSRMVHLDPGTELDLGGIVKGWAVERIADWLQRSLHIPAGMINAGGDIQVWGTPAHTSWTLYITDPFLEKRNLTGSIQLDGGAVATSSLARRQWLHPSGNGQMAHHLIDPRTMQSANTDIVQCTVLGQHTSQCEIIAKTVCILGSEEAIRWLNRHYDRHDVLWVTRDGSMWFRGNTEKLAERWPGFDPDHRFSLI
ncbi:FAD:protein FMN transferase [Paenibacillus tundrae]|uniref:FAD:protein FMN transferase n=1 Tax=Paenibacillus tundrae TaxID=528187 RepID=UPI0030D2BA29